LQVIFAATLTRGRLKSQIKVSDGTEAQKSAAATAPLLTERERERESECAARFLLLMAAVHLDNCLFSPGFGPVCGSARAPGFKGEVTPAGHRDKA
jgi:hypothetical protein